MRETETGDLIQSRGVTVSKGLPFQTREPTPEDIAEARQILGMLSWGRHIEEDRPREQVERAYYLLGGDAYVNAGVERRAESCVRGCFA